MNDTNKGTPEWTARPERSHTAIIRLMVWISLRLGRPIGRLILHGITVYFLLFAPAARRASRAYLQRALGRTPHLLDHYRQVFAFSSTLHDRIYLLNDRNALFDIEFVGDELIHNATAQGSGVILLGAHMGSFEVLRALGRQRSPVPVAVVMYQENARKFNDVLAAINPAAANDIIPLAQLDSMLRVKDRLDRFSGAVDWHRMKAQVALGADQRIQFLQIRGFLHTVEKIKQPHGRMPGINQTHAIKKRIDPEPSGNPHLGMPPCVLKQGTIGSLHPYLGARRYVLHRLRTLANRLD